jgi:hypothetical protein
MKINIYCLFPLLKKKKCLSKSGFSRETKKQVADRQIDRWMDGWIDRPIKRPTDACGAAMFNIYMAG